jgi:phospholipid transport system substrate-binding protein
MLSRNVEMRLRRRSVVFGMLASGAASPAWANEAAEAALDRLVAGAQELASRPPGAARDAAMRALLRSGADLEAVGRFVLGRHWRSASEAERAEFLRLFEDRILDGLGRRLGDTGPFQAVRGRARPSGEGVEIPLRIRPERGGAEIETLWRLEPGSGGWKVTDVVAEGISLRITTRSEYAAIIQRSGISGLLEALRRGGG